MAVINHQNNFATNLTSNQDAAVTTTPLNSIPSVAAPFFLALDATNINSKYEVIYVTSKTATNVNHAATTYAHTTAEEVRMIIPAVEMDQMFHAPQGLMRNGKLSVTVSSNDLVVALKTQAGNDPSITDPVIVRIGDTERIITAALSVTAADGTNWFNSGSAELGTQQVDYFAYLGFNATDGVVIGFSRIPYAQQYGDFSATTTDEKFCKISTITTAASTDNYEVVGRFTAILSLSGTSHVWTVPTFTPANLIQRPIYETRFLTWAPTWTGYSANPTHTAQYRLIGQRCWIDVASSSNGTSNANTNKFTGPFKVGITRDGLGCLGNGVDNGSRLTTQIRLDLTAASNLFTFYKDGAGNVWTTSNGKWISITHNFEI